MDASCGGKHERDARETYHGTIMEIETRHNRNAISRRVADPELGELR